MTRAPSKDELRARFTASRRAMDAESRDSARAAVREHVLERCRDEGWRCVAAYEPWTTEPGSFELLDALASLGIRVIVPVTRPDHDLGWAQRPGSGALLGREVIASADALLVPALAVAADGTRLGRGWGAYDRALARCGPGTVLAALLFDGELVAELPRDEWDVAVGATVTPSGWRNTGVRPGD